MRLLRSALFNLGFYFLVVVLMIAALPALAQGGAAIEWHARRWARLSLALLERTCGTKVDFRGLENLPPGAALVAAKHQSTLDVLALILAVERFSFIYKHELDMLPLFGSYLRSCGQILDRPQQARRRPGADHRRRRPDFRGGPPAGDFPGRHAPPCRRAAAL